MQVSFEIPAAEMANFQATLKAYYEETGKDAAYVVNRQALNVAIKAAQRTPLANAGAIKALPVSKPWWPRFVMKRIEESKEVERRSDSIGVSNGKKRKSRAKPVHSRFFLLALMHEKSKRLVRARLSHRGWIRSGWNPAIKALSALKLETAGRGAAGTPAFTKSDTRARRAPGAVKIARPGLSPIAEIINLAGSAVAVGADALREGLAAAANDMDGYIAKKYGETAKKFSA